MPYRPGVEGERVGGLAEPHAAHVLHRMAQRRVHVVQQRAGRAHEVGPSLEAEPVKPRHAEVPQQRLARRVEAERPGLGPGDVQLPPRLRNAPGVVLGGGQHELGRAVAGDGVLKPLLRLERLHHELARRKVQHGEPQAARGGDVGVGVLVQQTVLRDRAGRDDPRHLAAHHVPLLDEARILHLVAYRGERVVGDAAEGRAGALRERRAEDGRGDDGVLPEHLVEVAEAEHQDGAGRQLALYRAVLALHRRQLLTIAPCTDCLRAHGRKCIKSAARGSTDIPRVLRGRIAPSRRGDGRPAR